MRTVNGEVCLNKYLLALRNLTVWISSVAVAIPALIACWPGDSQVCDLVDQLRLQCLYLTLPVLGLLLLMRTWKDHPRFLALAVLATISHCGDIALAYARPLPLEAASSALTGRSTLRVLDSNLQLGNRCFDLFSDVVARTKPDVICLEELSNDWRQTLEKLKVSQDYPYQAVYPRNDYGGMGILSRYPIVDQKVIYVEKLAFPSIVVRLEVPSTSGSKQVWSVACIHTAAPLLPVNFHRRNREMAAMAKIGRELKAPAVFCGDFNCVPWSQYFKLFEEESGLTNTGRGGLPELSWSSIAPEAFRIPIDHVFTSKDVLCKSHKMEGNVGSDHYPIVVEVSY